MNRVCGLPRYKRFVIKLVAIGLVISFSALEIAQAAPIEALSSPPDLSQIILQDPGFFEAPMEFTALREVHKGDKNILIIHIQDAHSNLSGQQNLANALDQMMTKYGVSLVLSEGGSGDCSLTPLKKIAPPEVWKRIAKSYLVQGKISGEEYLNLTSDHPMKIIGIEDTVLYVKSVAHYGELADKREDILGYLKEIQAALDKLKRKMYPAELVGFEEKKKNNGGTGFESSFKELLELAQTKNMDLSAFPNVMKLIELQLKEKLVDFNLANLEQAALMDELTKKGAETDLKAHLEKMMQMKGVKVAQHTYFQNVFRIAQEKGVLLAKYPNFQAYGEYLKDFSELNLDQVLDELVRAEDSVYLALLTTPDQKLVRSIDRYLGLLKVAYNIQMSTKEFNLFKANEPDFGTIPYLAFINRKLAELDYFEDMIPYKNMLEEGKEALEAFYDSVTKRDFAFIQNTEQILQEENQKIAVLISGGYHTPHLKELFQAKGYSYAVLTPLVTSETNQKKYEKQLLAPIKPEIKKLDIVRGENANDKSLSALEKDLVKSKKKSDGVRTVLAAYNVNMDSLESTKDKKILDAVEQLQSYTKNKLLLPLIEDVVRSDKKYDNKTEEEKERIIQQAYNDIRSIQGQAGARMAVQIQKKEAEEKFLLSDFGLSVLFTHDPEKPGEPAIKIQSRKGMPEINARAVFDSATGKYVVTLEQPITNTAGLSLQYFSVDSPKGIILRPGQYKMVIDAWTAPSSLVPPLSNLGVFTNLRGQLESMRSLLKRLNQASNAAEKQSILEEARAILRGLREHQEVINRNLTDNWQASQLVIERLIDIIVQMSIRNDTRPLNLGVVTLPMAALNKIDMDMADSIKRDFMNNLAKKLNEKGVTIRLEPAYREASGASEAVEGGVRVMVLGATDQQYPDIQQTWHETLDNARKVARASAKTTPDFKTISRELDALKNENLPIAVGHSSLFAPEIVKQYLAGHPEVASLSDLAILLQKSRVKEGEEPPLTPAQQKSVKDFYGLTTVMADELRINAVAMAQVAEKLAENKVLSEPVIGSSSMALLATYAADIEEAKGKSVPQFELDEKDTSGELKIPRLTHMAKILEQAFADFEAALESGQKADIEYIKFQRTFSSFFLRSLQETRYKRLYKYDSMKDILRAQQNGKLGELIDYLNQLEMEVGLLSPEARKEVERGPPYIISFAEIAAALGQKLKMTKKGDEIWLYGGVAMAAAIEIRQIFLELVKANALISAYSPNKVHIRDELFFLPLGQILSFYEEFLAQHPTQGAAFNSSEEARQFAEQLVDKFLDTEITVSNTPATRDPSGFRPNTSAAKVVIDGKTITIPAQEIKKEDGSPLVLRAGDKVKLRAFLYHFNEKVYVPSGVQKRLPIYELTPGAGGEAIKFVIYEGNAYALSKNPDKNFNYFGNQNDLLDDELKSGVEVKPVVGRTNVTVTRDLAQQMAMDLFSPSHIARKNSVQKNLDFDELLKAYNYMVNMPSDESSTYIDTLVLLKAIMAEGGFNPNNMDAERVKAISSFIRAAKQAGFKTSSVTGARMATTTSAEQKLASENGASVVNLLALPFNVYWTRSSVQEGKEGVIEPQFDTKDSTLTAQIKQSANDPGIFTFTLSRSVESGGVTFQVFDLVAPANLPITLDDFVRAERAIAQPLKEPLNLAEFLSRSYDAQLEAWKGGKRPIRRVLVVDDDSSIRNLNAMMLEGLLKTQPKDRVEMVEVLKATTCEEALQEYGNQSFDLIVSDGYTGGKYLGPELLKHFHDKDLKEGKTSVQQQTILVLNSGTVSQVMKDAEDKGVDPRDFGDSFIYIEKNPLKAAKNMPNLARKVSLVPEVVGARMAAVQAPVVAAGARRVVLATGIQTEERLNEVRIERPATLGPRSQVVFRDVNGRELPSRFLGAGGYAAVYEVEVAGKSYAFRLPIQMPRLEGRDKGSVRALLSFIQNIASKLNPDGALEEFPVSYPTKVQLDLADRLKEYLDVLYLEDVFYQKETIANLTDSMFKKPEAALSYLTDLFKAAPENFPAETRAKGMVERKDAEEYIRAQWVKIGEAEKRLQGASKEKMAARRQVLAGQIESMLAGQFFIVEEPYDRRATPMDDPAIWAPLSEGEKMGLLRGIHDAIVYMHSKDILHRDIKPGNILLWRDDAGKLHFKITDMGSALDLNDRFMKKLEQDTGVAANGTPEFYPRNFNETEGRLSTSNGYSSSPRLDYFPWGVSVFQLLTGFNMSKTLKVEPTVKVLGKKEVQRVYSRDEAVKIMQTGIDEAIKNANISQGVKNYLYEIFRADFDEPMVNDLDSLAAKAFGGEARKMAAPRATAALRRELLFANNENGGLIRAGQVVGMNAFTFENSATELQVARSKDDNPMISVRLEGDVLKFYSGTQVVASKAVQSLQSGKEDLVSVRLSLDEEQVQGVYFFVSKNTEGRPVVTKVRNSPQGMGFYLYQARGARLAERQILPERLKNAPGATNKTKVLRIINESGQEQLVRAKRVNLENEFSVYARKTVDDEANVDIDFKLVPGAQGQLSPEAQRLIQVNYEYIYNASDTAFPYGMYLVTFDLPQPIFLNLYQLSEETQQQETVFKVGQRPTPVSQGYFLVDAWKITRFNKNYRTRLSESFIPLHSLLPLQEIEWALATQLITQNGFAGLAEVYRDIRPSLDGEIDYNEAATEIEKRLRLIQTRAKEGLYDLENFSYLLSLVEELYEEAGMPTAGRSRLLEELRDALPQIKPRATWEELDWVSALSLVGATPENEAQLSTDQGVFKKVLKNRIELILANSEPSAISDLRRSYDNFVKNKVKEALEARKQDDVTYLLGFIPETYSLEAYLEDIGKKGQAWQEANLGLSGNALQAFKTALSQKTEGARLAAATQISALANQNLAPFDFTQAPFNLFAVRTSEGTLVVRAEPTRNGPGIKETKLRNLENNTQAVVVTLVDGSVYGPFVVGLPVNLPTAPGSKKGVPAFISPEDLARTNLNANYVRAFRELKNKFPSVSPKDISIISAVLAAAVVESDVNPSLALEAYKVVSDELRGRFPGSFSPQAAVHLTSLALRLIETADRSLEEVIKAKEIKGFAAKAVDGYRSMSRGGVESAEAAAILALVVAELQSSSGAPADAVEKISFSVVKIYTRVAAGLETVKTAEPLTPAELAYFAAILSQALLAVAAHDVDAAFTQNAIDQNANNLIQSLREDVLRNFQRGGLKPNFAAILSFRVYQLLSATPGPWDRAKLRDLTDRALNEYGSYYDYRQSTTGLKPTPTPDMAVLTWGMPGPAEVELAPVFPFQAEKAKLDEDLARAVKALPEAVPQQLTLSTSLNQSVSDYFDLLEEQPSQAPADEDYFEGYLKYLQSYVDRINQNNFENSDREARVRSILEAFQAIRNYTDENSKKLLPDIIVQDENFKALPGSSGAGVTQEMVGKEMVKRALGQLNFRKNTGRGEGSFNETDATLGRAIPELLEITKSAVTRGGLTDQLLGRLLAKNSHYFMGYDVRGNELKGLKENNAVEFLRNLSSGARMAEQAPEPGEQIALPPVQWGESEVDREKRELKEAYRQFVEPYLPSGEMLMGYGTGGDMEKTARQINGVMVLRKEINFSNLATIGTGEMFDGFVQGEGFFVAWSTDYLANFRKASDAAPFFSFLEKNWRGILKFRVVTSFLNFLGFILGKAFSPVEVYPAQRVVFVAFSDEKIAEARQRFGNNPKIVTFREAAQMMREGKIVPPGGLVAAGARMAAQVSAPAQTAPAQELTAISPSELSLNVFLVRKRDGGVEAKITSSATNQPPASMQESVENGLLKITFLDDSVKAPDGSPVKSVLVSTAGMPVSSAALYPVTRVRVLEKTAPVRAKFRREKTGDRKALIGIIENRARVRVKEGRRTLIVNIENRMSSFLSNKSGPLELSVRGDELVGLDKLISKLNEEGFWPERNAMEEVVKMNAMVSEYNYGNLEVTLTASQIPSVRPQGGGTEEGARMATQVVEPALPTVSLSELSLHVFLARKRDGGVEAKITSSATNESPASLQESVENSLLKITFLDDSVKAPDGSVIKSLLVSTAGTPADSAALTPVTDARVLEKSAAPSFNTFAESIDKIKKASGIKSVYRNKNQNLIRALNELDGAIRYLQAQLSRESGDLLLAAQAKAANEWDEFKKSATLTEEESAVVQGAIDAAAQTFRQAVDSMPGKALPSKNPQATLQSMVNPEGQIIQAVTDISKVESISRQIEALLNQIQATTGLWADNLSADNFRWDPRTGKVNLVSTDGFKLFTESGKAFVRARNVAAMEKQNAEAATKLTYGSIKIQRNDRERVEKLDPNAIGFVKELSIGKITDAEKAGSFADVHQITFNGQPAAIKLAGGVAIAGSEYTLQNLQEAKRSFMENVQTASRIKQENLDEVQKYIPVLFAVYHPDWREGQDTDPAIVMEFIQGPDLDDYLRSNPDKLASILEQYEKLQEVFKRQLGQYASDVRISNFKVREDGRLVLVDFGQTIPFIEGVSEEMVSQVNEGFKSELGTVLGARLATRKERAAPNLSLITAFLKLSQLNLNTRNADLLKEALPVLKYEDESGGGVLDLSNNFGITEMNKEVLKQLAELLETIAGVDKNDPEKMKVVNAVLFYFNRHKIKEPFLEERFINELRTGNPELLDRFVRAAKTVSVVLAGNIPAEAFYTDRVRPLVETPLEKFVRLVGEKPNLAEWEQTVLAPVDPVQEIDLTRSPVVEVIAGGGQTADGRKIPSVKLIVFRDEIDGAVRVLRLKDSPTGSVFLEIDGEPMALMPGETRLARGEGGHIFLGAAQIGSQPNSSISSVRLEGQRQLDGHLRFELRGDKLTVVDVGRRAAVYPASRVGLALVPVVPKVPLVDFTAGEGKIEGRQVRFPLDQTGPVTFELGDMAFQIKKEGSSYLLTPLDLAYFDMEDMGVSQSFSHYVAQDKGVTLKEGPGEVNVIGRDDTTGDTLLNGSLVSLPKEQRVSRDRAILIKVENGNLIVEILPGKNPVRYSFVPSVAKSAVKKKTTDILKSEEEKGAIGEFVEWLATVFETTAPGGRRGEKDIPYWLGQIKGRLDFELGSNYQRLYGKRLLSDSDKDALYQALETVIKGAARPNFSEASTFLRKFFRPYGIVFNHAANPTGFGAGSILVGKLLYEAPVGDTPVGYKGFRTIDYVKPLYTRNIAVSHKPSNHNDAVYVYMGYQHNEPLDPFHWENLFVAVHEAVHGMDAAEGLLYQMTDTGMEFTADALAIHTVLEYLLREGRAGRRPGFRKEVKDYLKFMIVELGKGYFGRKDINPFGQQVGDMTVASINIAEGHAGSVYNRVRILFEAFSGRKMEAREWPTFQIQFQKFLDNPNLSDRDLFSTVERISGLMKQAAEKRYKEKFSTVPAYVLNPEGGILDHVLKVRSVAGARMAEISLPQDIQRALSDLNQQAAQIQVLDAGNLLRLYELLDKVTPNWSSEKWLSFQQATLRDFLIPVRSLLFGSDLVWDVAGVTANLKELQRWIDQLDAEDGFDPNDKESATKLIQSLDASIGAMTQVSVKREQRYVLQQAPGIQDLDWLARLSFEVGLEVDKDGKFVLEIGDRGSVRRGDSLHTHPYHATTKRTSPGPSDNDIQLGASNFSDVGLLYVENKRKKKVLEDNAIDQAAQSAIVKMQEASIRYAAGETEVDMFTAAVGDPEVQRALANAGLAVRFIPRREIQDLSWLERGTVQVKLKDGSSVNVTPASQQAPVLGARMALKEIGPNASENFPATEPISVRYGPLVVFTASIVGNQLVIKPNETLSSNKPAGLQIPITSLDHAVLIGEKPPLLKRIFQREPDLVLNTITGILVDVKITGQPGQPVIQIRNRGQTPLRVQTPERPPRLIGKAEGLRMLERLVQVAEQRKLSFSTIVDNLTYANREGTNQARMENLYVTELLKDVLGDDRNNKELLAWLSQQAALENRVRQEDVRKKEAAALAVLQSFESLKREYPEEIIPYLEGSEFEELSDRLKAMIRVLRARQEGEGFVRPDQLESDLMSFDENINEIRVRSRPLFFYDFWRDPNVTRLIAAVLEARSRPDPENAYFILDAGTVPKITPQMAREFLAEGYSFIEEGKFDLVLKRASDNPGRTKSDYEDVLKVIGQSSSRQAIKVQASRVGPGDRIRMRDGRMVKVEKIEKGNVSLSDESGGAPSLILRQTLQEIILEDYDKSSGAKILSSGGRLAEAALFTAQEVKSLADFYLAMPRKPLSDTFDLDKLEYVRLGNVSLVMRGVSKRDGKTYYIKINLPQNYKDPETGEIYRGDSARAIIVTGREADIQNAVKNNGLLGDSIVGTSAAKLTAGEKPELGKLIAAVLRSPKYNETGLRMQDTKTGESFNREDVNDLRKSLEKLLSEQGAVPYLVFEDAAGEKDAGGRTVNVPFVQYLEGLKNSGQLSDDTAMKGLFSIVGRLRTAHQQGLLLRDNGGKDELFMNSGDHTLAKILDLGYASYEGRGAPDTVKAGVLARLGIAHYLKSTFYFVGDPELDRNEIFRAMVRGNSYLRDFITALQVIREYAEALPNRSEMKKALIALRMEALQVFKNAVDLQNPAAVGTYNELRGDKSPASLGLSKMTLDYVFERLREEAGRALSRRAGFANYRDAVKEYQSSPEKSPLRTAAFRFYLMAVNGVPEQDMDLAMAAQGLTRSEVRFGPAVVEAIQNYELSKRAEAQNVQATQVRLTKLAQLVGEPAYQRWGYQRATVRYPQGNFPVLRRAAGLPVRQAGARLAAHFHPAERTFKGAEAASAFQAAFEENVPQVLSFLGLERNDSDKIASYEIYRKRDTRSGIGYRLVYEHRLAVPGRGVFTFIVKEDKLPAEADKSDPEIVKTISSINRAYREEKSIADEVFKTGHGVKTELLETQDFSKLIEFSAQGTTIDQYAVDQTVAEALGSALGAVHGAGAVNEDWKPDHVYLNEKKDIGKLEVTFIDFGEGQRGLSPDNPRVIEDKSTFMKKFIPDQPALIEKFNQAYAAALEDQTSLAESVAPAGLDGRLRTEAAKLVTGDRIASVTAPVVETYSLRLDGAAKLPALSTSRLSQDQLNKFLEDDLLKAAFAKIVASRVLQQQSVPISALPQTLNVIIVFTPQGQAIAFPTVAGISVDAGVKFTPVAADIEAVRGGRLAATAPSLSTSAISSAPVLPATLVTAAPDVSVDKIVTSVLNKEKFAINKALPRIFGSKYNASTGKVTLAPGQIAGVVSYIVTDSLTPMEIEQEIAAHQASIQRLRSKFETGVILHQIVLVSVGKAAVDEARSDKLPEQAVKMYYGEVSQDLLKAASGADAGAIVTDARRNSDGTYNLYSHTANMLAVLAVAFADEQSATRYLGELTQSLIDSAAFKEVQKVPSTATPDTFRLHGLVVQKLEKLAIELFLKVQAAVTQAVSASA